MLKNYLNFLMVWVLAGNAFAQAPDTLWTRTYGGELGDFAYSLLEASTGDFIIGGATSSFGAGLWDVWLLCINSDGDSIWSQTYGGEFNEFAFSVKETAGNDLLIGGWTDSFGAGDADVWIIKTDIQGDSLLSCTFGGDNADYAYSLIETQSGDYLMAGTTASFCSGALDGWIILTDTGGDSLWTCALGGPGTESIYSVIQSSDGGYLFAGATSSTPTSYNDIWLVKTDVDGDLIWSQTYGGNGDDFAYSIIETQEGNFVLAGYSDSFSSPGDDYDIWLIKVDACGDSIWSRFYGWEDNDIANSVIETSDGDYIFTGWTRSFGPGDSDVWLMKTDSEGDSLWFCTFGGSGNDYAYSVIETSSGDYLIAGETHSINFDVWDAWLICVDGPPTGIEPDTPVIPFTYGQLNAFPNPFNSGTWLTFALPAPCPVELEIFDLRGSSIVKLLDDDIYKRGSHRYYFDATDLSSGVYFCRFLASDFSTTQKILLIK